MKLRTTLAACGMLCGLVGFMAYSAGYSRGEETAAARVYELRTYTTEPGPAAGPACAISRPHDAAVRKARHSKRDVLGADR
jgi:hypothetical protein